MNGRPVNATPGSESSRHPELSSWWRALPEAPSATGARLDPATPRALWYLIQIGEMVGLVGPTDETKILNAFQANEDSTCPGAAIVARLDCSVTDLFVLITLFAATPRTVPIPLVARDTIADPAALRTSLNHLHELKAIEPRELPNGEVVPQLTVHGSRLAVLLIYRVIKAVV